MTDPEPARRLPPTVLATCVLPWDDRLRLDEGAFRETCGRFGQAQFLHYNTPRGGRVLTGAEYGRLAAEHASLAAVKFTSSDPAVVAELVRNAAPVQCFLTEPAYVLADGNCGLLVSLSGARLGLPGRFQAARGAGLRELGRLAEAVDELLEDSFRAACPSAHMDGAYEKVLARAHGARLARPRRGVKGFNVELSDQQHALLARSRNGVLATTGPAGSPHAAPVWYLWDGTEIRISTPRTTQKVRDIERDPRVAFVVDDQVAGEYLTLYGEAVIVADERVAGLTWPLLLGYMPPAEATARWERINADGSRVVIVLRPASVTGRQQVR